MIAAGLMTGGVLGVARADAVEPRLSSSAEKTTEVSLGVHTFDKYATPDFVAAKVGADGVGW